MSPWLKTEDTEPARNKRTRARRQTTRTTTTRQQKRASGLASRWPRSPPTLARSNKLGTLTQPTPREVNPGVSQPEDCRFCYNPALSTNHATLGCALNSPSCGESNGAI